MTAIQRPLRAEPESGSSPMARRCQQTQQQGLKQLETNRLNPYINFLFYQSGCSCHPIMARRYSANSMPAATCAAVSRPIDCSTSARANGAAAAGPLPVTTLPSTATGPSAQRTPSMPCSMPG